MDILHVFTDGSSHGNPGPASYAVLVCDAQDQPLPADGVGFANPYCEYIGHETNNVAEYRAIIQGLTLLKALPVAAAVFVSDSELVVRQLTGQYKVKNEGLRPLYEQAMGLLRTVGKRVQFTHVRRGHPNIHMCDRAANATTDRVTGRVREAGMPEAGAAQMTLPL